MCNQQEIGNALNHKLAELRKTSGMTQGQLAQRLGLSFQAVSKWEKGQSCPDISLLPILADIYEVSLDHLFGRDAREEKQESGPSTETGCRIPWPDDGKVRAAVFIGTQLITENLPEQVKEIVFHYEGEARDVISSLGLSCGNITGSASAGGSINAGLIGGDVRCGGGIDCANVGGSVTSDGGVNCDGVGGCVTANGGVSCGDIRGSLEANGAVTCDHVSGDVSASGDVAADTISGNVSCGGHLECDRIEGDVTLPRGAQIHRESIGGQVHRR